MPKASQVNELRASFLSGYEKNSHKGVATDASVCLSTFPKCIAFQGKSAALTYLFPFHLSCLLQFLFTCLIYCFEKKYGFS
jgi:hypothetical protein